MEKITLVCAFCNKDFIRYPSQIKKRPGVNAGRFCSKECMDKSRQHGDILRCKMCDTSFYRRAGEQGDTKNPFCSVECYKNYRILNAKKTTYLKNGAKHRHIIIAEKYLKRKLRKGEVVHHIDENKHNNSIENLAVLPSQKIHAMVHFGSYDITKYRLINLIK